MKLNGSLIVYLVITQVYGITAADINNLEDADDSIRKSTGILRGAPLRHAIRAHQQKYKRALEHDSADDLSTVIIPSQSRIVGGNNAPDGKFPFFVQGDGCGGTLVAPDVILTVAHCAGAFDNEVRVGSIWTDEGGQVVDTIKSRQTAHPDYNSRSNENDIMLVKLEEDADFPSVAINFDENNPATGSDADLTVIGFGALESGGGSRPNRLQQVDVNYVDPLKCEDFYDGIDAIQSDIMLCAGVPEGGKDSCQGDSGGPILDQNGAQVGIVSFGKGCAEAEFPGAYTRVSAFSSWLKDNICRMATTSPDYCFEVTDGDSDDDADGDSDDDEGGSDLESVEVRINVVVTHDDYPEETAWTLKDSSNTVIMSQDESDVNDASAVVTRVANVASGSYKFSIADSEGDGICCANGEGKVEIYVDRRLVKILSGDFGSSTSFTFSTSDDTTEENGNVDNNVPSITYKITAQYDEYAEETGFWIRDRSNDEIVFRRRTGVIDTPNVVYNKEVDLLPDRTYILAVRDGYGDGLDGFVEVYALVGEEEQKHILAHDDGNFEFRRNTSFRVPTTYTEADAESNDSSEASSDSS